MLTASTRFFSFTRRKSITSSFHGQFHRTMEIQTTSTNPPWKVNIHMTSDLICKSFQTSSRVQTYTLSVELTRKMPGPFCIIGLRNLQKGIEIAKASGCPVDVNLKLLPFILDPSLTDTPVSRQAKYEAKYGHAGLASREAQIAAIGKTVGVNM